MSLYGIAKDFAAPAATFVASLVGLSLVYSFNRFQKRAGLIQIAIAQDKLKADLFERRYEIYLATKSLLEYVIHVRKMEQADPAKVRALYITLDECRFFFPPDIQAHLRNVATTVEQLLTLVGQRDVMNIDDAAQWAASADEIGRVSVQLSAMYADLPQTFEKTLSFERVTSPG